MVNTLDPRLRQHRLAAAPPVLAAGPPRVAAAPPSASPAFAQRNMAPSKGKGKGKGNGKAKAPQKGKKGKKRGVVAGTPTPEPELEQGMEPEGKAEAESTPDAQPEPPLETDQELEVEPKPKPAAESTPATLSESLPSRPQAQAVAVQQFLDALRAFYLSCNDGVSQIYFTNLCRSYLANSEGGELGFYTDVLRLLHSGSANDLVGMFKSLAPQDWKQEDLRWLDDAVENDAKVMAMVARMRRRMLERMAAEDEDDEEEAEYEDGDVEMVNGGEAVAFTTSEGSHVPPASEPGRHQWSDISAFLAAEAAPSSSLSDLSSPMAATGFGNMDTSTPTPAVRKRKVPINGFRASNVSDVVGIDGCMAGKYPDVNDSSLMRMAEYAGVESARKLRVSFYSNLYGEAEEQKQVARTPEKKLAPSKTTPTEEQLLVKLPVSPSIKDGKVTLRSDDSTPAPSAKNDTAAKKAMASNTSSMSPPAAKPRSTAATKCKVPTSRTASTTPDETETEDARPMLNLAKANPSQKIYPTTRAILRRPLTRPYVHALCGQRFGHYAEVQRHHNGQSGRPGCWAKSGKPMGEGGRWDADGSCGWTLKDLRYRAVPGGFVVEDWMGVGVGVEGIREDGDETADQNEGGAEVEDEDHDEEGEREVVPKVKRRKLEHARESTPSSVADGNGNGCGGREEAIERPVKRRKAIKGEGKVDVKVEEHDMAALRSAATGLRKRR